MDKDFLSISYFFHFDEKDEVVFETIINTPSMIHSLPRNYVPPEWAKTFRCSICPSPPDDATCCNMCGSIAYLVNEFKAHKPDEPCTISVRTENRNYTLKQDFQTGFFSILGLYLATSDCPHLCFLKPLARFHLPFASSIETTFRTIGAYLLGEFFKSRKGTTPDWNLQNLAEAYKRVSTVNTEIISHLKKVKLFFLRSMQSRKLALTGVLTSYPEFHFKPLEPVNISETRSAVSLSLSFEFTIPASLSSFSTKSISSSSALFNENCFKRYYSKTISEKMCFSETTGEHSVSIFQYFSKHFPNPIILKFRPILRARLEIAV